MNGMTITPPPPPAANNGVIRQSDGTRVTDASRRIVLINGPTFQDPFLTDLLRAAVPARVSWAALAPAGMGIRLGNQWQEAARFDVECRNGCPLVIFFSPGPGGSCPFSVWMFGV